MPGAVKESQSDKFKQAARELGCDESEERFNENLKRIVKAKPEEKGEKPK